ncbi:nucleoside-triphosphatase [Deferribacter desulfuricans SSM1]|uniref:dITP/XTP pyrophosphatase n=1 Tax=Deferribacter desulfuricans (strain DSM 14783 / JCM 11476 / NBRC 101012 / SSM1) TaxID=639282 RepID=D3PBG8_DEFDS|nr:XTP/dITP diphosphatase [Deferribacter desulfuricans]BAI79941.1 nucleoside-triphosphatase [Deferribacter desulfuricans SSM1]
MIDKVYVATKNKGKLKEISEILKPIEVISVYEVVENPVDIVEDGSTFEENARKKGEELSRFVEGYVIADDSGLVVEVLNGKPGIYSARYAGENATDMENNLKLLKELEGTPFENRDAKFVCVIALCKDGKTIETFYGECKGKIGFELKGENGFGYDPLFVLDNGRTMAELSSDEKNRISHRREALAKLKKFLDNVSKNN